ncbi:MAG: RtcB family protein [Bacteroidales bacterium]|nr:RtcB family protein [Bacteroidales bacterium]
MSDLKIFTTTIEGAALEMINAIAEHPYFENQKIRIMPDTHAGNAIVVGFTCPVGPYLNPEHVGTDIGCGIETELFDKLLPVEQFPLFEQRVRNAIPMGKDINTKREFDLKEFCKFVRKELSRAAQSSDGLVCEVPFNNERDISAWCKSLNLDEKTFYKSIGTLGGGNHFIELDYNEEQELMGATVHTGSRNIGQKVCNRWAKKAIATKGYLSGNLLSQYLTDMVVAQAYAQYNRKIILDKIADIYKKLCKGRVVETISSVHNYLDFSDMIIRKGAIRSYVGERMVIPFNMRDGLAICEGKSNDDWNCSAPHGAGRLLSRNKAKELLTMEAFREAMSDIYSTSVCEGTLDESPMAYKDTQTILREIEPTCKILYFMKPVVNLKDTGK